MRDFGIVSVKLWGFKLGSVELGSVELGSVDLGRCHKPSSIKAFS